MSQRNGSRESGGRGGQSAADRGVPRTPGSNVQPNENAYDLQRFRFKAEVAVAIQYLAVGHYSGAGEVWS